MIKMKDIVREGHPSLRRKAEEATFPLSSENARLAEDLHRYVKDSQTPEIAERYGLRPGIGLAAPQVDRSVRMFALHIKEGARETSFVAVNPKIISHSVERTYLPAGEGCLSVDRPIEGYVPRYARITAVGYSPDGTPFRMRLKGLPAIAFQHELDHLNGIMFFDYIDAEQPLAKIAGATPYEEAPLS